MAFVTETYQAFLNAPMEADAVHLPVGSAAYADLLKLLSAEPGNYTFLTIKDDTSMETVKAKAEGGYILLERGLEGTEAVKHPFGACVTAVSPTIIAVIKDLFCNYTCCETAPCDCIGVYLIDATLPEGNVGVEWEGRITLGGTQPLNVSVEGAPAWMTVVQERSLVRLYGTPTEAGALSLRVVATNCKGVLSEVLQVVINQ